MDQWIHLVSGKPRNVSHQANCVSFKDTGFAVLTNWRQTPEREVRIRQTRA